MTLLPSQQDTSYAMLGTAAGHRVVVGRNALKFANSLY